jgi:hypothetical protein
MVTRDFTKFDAFINSIGLLIHEGEGGAPRRTDTIDLDVPQTDIGNAADMPSALGKRFAQDDFSHGAGQEFFHRKTSDPAKFLYSEGVDISTPGVMKPLRATALALGGALTAGATGRCCQVGNQLFVTDHNNVRVYSDVTSSPTTEDPGAGETQPVAAVGPTRFYPQNAAAPASPAFSASWDANSGVRKNLTTSKSGALAEQTLTEVATTKGGMLQLVSPALATGTVFSTSDTISAVFDVRESAGSPDGPLSPGTLASDSSNGGDAAWLTPSAAGTSNDSRTGPGVDFIDVGDTTHYLKATNYGFSIPTNATVTGVKVEIERVTFGATDVRDHEVKLVKGGSVVGDNHASGTNWSLTEAYYGYGGATDLWGTTFTPAEINNSGFGMVLSVENVGGGGPAVDHIRITVYYTLTTLAITARVFASDNTTVRATLFDNTASGVDSSWDESGTAHGGSTRRQGVAALAASYTTIANDYLVVEVGFRSLGGAGTAALSYGGSAADYLLASGDTATGHGWVELSTGITLASGAPDAVIYDVANANTDVYGAMGANGIHKRTGSTWASWSSVAAIRIALLKDTIFAASATQFYSVDAAGAGTTIGSPLRVGWQFTDIAEAGDHIYASAVNETIGRSRIHRYALSGDGTAFEHKGSTSMPENELVYSLKGYLDVLLIGAGRKNPSGGKDALTYLAVPDGNGALTYDLIADSEGAGSRDLATRAITTAGRRFLFGWTLGTAADFGEREGLASFDIALAAFVHDLASSTDTATPESVLSCTVLAGRKVFVTPDGVYYENFDLPVNLAYLISSVATWGNAGLKTWDTSEVTGKSLPSSNPSVVLQYTTHPPKENQWEDAGQWLAVGSTSAEFRHTDVASRALAVKIFLLSNLADSPEVHTFSVRSNPTIEESEFVLVRTFRVFDKDRAASTHQEIRQDPRAIRNAIRALHQEWVTFYEADLPAGYDVKLTTIQQVHFTSYTDADGNPLGEGYLLTVAMKGTEA